MTTVFIWNNNQITHRFAKVFKYGPAQKEITGHSALNIDDNFTSLIDIRAPEILEPLDNKKSYVSWIPSNMKWGHSCEESHNHKDRGVGNRSFMADLLNEKYAPDHIIRIPNVSNEVMNRMRREWKRHLDPKLGRGQTYDLYRKNCSRITSRVLRRGWAKGGFNIRYGQLISGLWTPLMVKRLALDLKGKGQKDLAFKMSWDDLVNELVAKDVISGVTGFVMKKFRRRSSNRGSSMADARFKIKGSWRSHFKKGWSMSREDRNLDGEVFVYTELVGRSVNMKIARKIFANWLSITNLGFALGDDVEAVDSINKLVEANIKGIKGEGRMPLEKIKGKRGLKGRY
ncbi:MAG: hypothetical protein GY710_16995 [Desulfobacteraceae bacterium]|nr:hypothetical protein [Desulfobacteraceae bacterium]